MSTDWPIVKLADYCDKIGSGATPRGGSKVYLDSGEISLVRSQNVYNHGFDYDGLVYIDEEAAEKLSNVELEKSDVLINITGDSVARVCIVPDDVLPARVNQHVSILRPKNDSLDPRFLRYSLVNYENQYKLLAIASSGGTRKAITKGHLEDFEIPLPDLSYQKEVSEILSTFDQKIHLNQQTNETLEAIAQGIFKSWFVDFDPVRAKIEATSAGCDLNRAAMAAIAGISSFAKAMEDRSFEMDWDEIEAALDQKLSNMTEEQRQQLTRTAQLFPDELEESEIGEVPKGWGISEFKSITKVLNGYAFKSKDYLNNSDGIFVLRTKNFGGNGLVERLNDDVYLPEEFLNEYSKYVCEPYDLQMVMVGASLGKLGMILPFQLPALRNQNMWCFRAKKENHKFFVDHYLKWSVPKMLSFASGSARSFFRKGDFQKMDVLLPHEELIDQFNGVVKPFYQKIASNSGESESLRYLRDTLLPKLISGEVEV